MGIKSKAQVTLGDIEVGLQKLFRLRGQMLPTSPEQVAAAERRLAKAQIAFPEKLDEIPQITLSASRRGSAPVSAAYWTNPSVNGLRADDPVEFVIRKSRDLVLSAIERGWSGPPYNPTELAELLGIALLPTEGVVDARTRSIRGKFQIEFNPMRPAARMRFSVAHEIAHTLFPDCAYATRNRATHEGMAGDEWQLEMLCNVAASEILMPTGSLPNPDDFVPTVDSVLGYRKRFQVSSEAVLLRLLRLASVRCVAFAAHRDSKIDRYIIDYAIRSRHHKGLPHLETGFVLPKEARAAECTAIGFTAKGAEKWLGGGEDWVAEYLGVAPYPGDVSPRVLGIVRPNVSERPLSNLTYLRGDASEPRGSGRKILLQLVNDRALTWGAGFAKTVRNKWPAAQRDFSRWTLSSRRDFRLGGIHVVDVRDDLVLISLVAQKGYGEAQTARIRYAALDKCLVSVTEVAKRYSATVHMPRIGAGLAGGSWAVIEEIIQQTLGREDISISVYDLPNRQPLRRPQLSLFDVPADLDQFV